LIHAGQLPTGKVLIFFVRVHNGYRGQTGYLQDGIHYSVLDASKKGQR